MTLRPERVLDIVNHQVGFKEEPTGSNRGPQVDLYTGGRAEPWCGHFIAWVFRMAGHPLPGDAAPSPKQANTLASITHMERVFQEHGWLYQEPRVGDVIFYRSRAGSDPGRGKHAGIVTSVGMKSITTVEGNWSDAVVRRTVPRNDPRVSGFGRPPYTD